MKKNQPRKKMTNKSQIVNNIKREKHIIDATEISYGRLCSQIAVLLMGKHKTDFEKHSDIGDFVIIENIEKIKFTGKKLDNKKYYRHSGYSGGLKSISLREKFEKNPIQCLKDTVTLMLPKNKLSKPRIKRLTVK